MAFFAGSDAFAMKLFHLRAGVRARMKRGLVGDEEDSGNVGYCWTGMLQLTSELEHHGLAVDWLGWMVIRKWK